MMTHSNTTKIYFIYRYIALFNLFYTDKYVFEFKKINKTCNIYLTDEPTIKKATSKSRGGDWADQMKQAENLVQELMHHDDAWPFLKPVSKKDVRI